MPQRIMFRPHPWNVIPPKRPFGRTESLGTLGLMLPAPQAQLAASRAPNQPPQKLALASAVTSRCSPPPQPNPVASHAEFSDPSLLSVAAESSPLDHTAAIQPIFWSNVSKVNFLIPTNGIPVDTCRAGM